MQGGYWISHRLPAPLPQLRNALFGHIVLFVARMSFVLATSIFWLRLHRQGSSHGFIVRRPEFQTHFPDGFEIFLAETSCTQSACIL
jgi:hypothetical protein